MRAAVHAAIVNLASLVRADDTLEDINYMLRELKYEMYAQRLRLAFTDVSRDYWAREGYGENQSHSIGVRHLHSVTEREFRGMAYGRNKDE